MSMNEQEMEVIDRQSIIEIDNHLRFFRNNVTKWEERLPKTAEFHELKNLIFNKQKSLAYWFDSIIRFFLSNVVYKSFRIILKAIFKPRNDITDLDKVHGALYEVDEIVDDNCEPISIDTSQQRYERNERLNYMRRAVMNMLRELGISEAFVRAKVYLALNKSYEEFMSSFNYNSTSTLLEIDTMPIEHLWFILRHACDLEDSSEPIPTLEEMQNIVNGDVAELQEEGDMTSLRLAQLLHKYRSFGTFLRDNNLIKQFFTVMAMKAIKERLSLMGQRVLIHDTTKILNYEIRTKTRSSKWETFYKHIQEIELASAVNGNVSNSQNSSRVRKNKHTRRNNHRSHN